MAAVAWAAGWAVQTILCQHRCLDHGGHIITIVITVRRLCLYRCRLRDQDHSRYVQCLDQYQCQCQHLALHLDQCLFLCLRHMRIQYRCQCLHIMHIMYQFQYRMSDKIGLAHKLC